jgi:hypothetical protein
MPVAPEGISALVAHALPHFEDVKQVAPLKWRARCPCHGGRTSLSLWQEPDGSLGLCCWWHANKEQGRWFFPCRPTRILRAAELDPAVYTWTRGPKGDRGDSTAPAEPKRPTEELVREALQVDPEITVTALARTIRKRKKDVADAVRKLRSGTTTARGSRKRVNTQHAEPEARTLGSQPRVNTHAPEPALDPPGSQPSVYTPAEPEPALDAACGSASLVPDSGSGSRVYSSREVLQRRTPAGGSRSRPKRKSTTQAKEPKKATSRASRATRTREDPRARFDVVQYDMVAGLERGRPTLTPERFAPAPADLFKVPKTRKTKARTNGR